MAQRGGKNILAILCLFILLPLFLYSSKKIGIKDLPSKHKEWLEEEVVHIITPKEKEVFLLLESNRERDIFIEAFWKQRDPTSGTPENEFKTEHYRRNAYANKFFGRETTTPGCLTDRGRIYIILGPPIDIDRFAGLKDVHPIEVWFYGGGGEVSLPRAFNLVFFKRRGMGEYVLYSPVQDGIQSLLLKYDGDPTDFEALYDEIRRLEPDVADYVLTLIPGERPLGSLSLISDVLISDIKTLPQKKVEDSYSKALLEYKDIIEVEYTANYIPCDFLVKVYQDESGYFFVHYSVEPKRISVGSIGDKYYTNFLLVGNFSDLKGKIFFQYENNFSLEFNKEQLKGIQGSSFAIQDMIPVIPGNHKFSLLIKNTTSKEFSSYEQNITIPQTSNSLRISPLLLGHASKREPKASNFLKAFQLGEFYFLTHSKASFDTSEKLNVFFQVYGLSSELRQNGLIRYTFMRDSSFYSKKSISLANYIEGINFKEDFSLLDFSPGYYNLKVSLLDNQENELLSESVEFEISPVARVPKPWVFSKTIPASHFEYDYILGNQYLNQGNLARAEELLGAAYGRDPSSLIYAMAFSHVLMQQEKIEKVKNILLPFAQAKQFKDFSFLQLLGQALQALKEYEAAIEYYKEYLVYRGTALEVLNAIGECYFCLGNSSEALVAWERSLEINPEQQEIAKKIKLLQKKELTNNKEF